MQFKHIVVSFSKQYHVSDAKLVIGLHVHGDS